MSARRGQRAALTLALPVVSVLCVLALGEVVVRGFDLGPTFQVESGGRFQASANPILEYELRPGTPDGESQTSSAGMRDREYPLAKPADVFRIAAIGDSVTYGGGAASPGSGWTKRLERLLGERALSGAPRFEVLNFGVSGYNIVQIAERLRVQGMSYDPDLIVYGYVMNDPQAFSIERARLQRRGERARINGTLLRSGVTWLAHSRLFLMTWHQLAARSAPLLGEGDPVYSHDDREGFYRSIHTSGPPLDRFVAGMAEIARIAREGGRPLVVAIFPVLSDGPYRLFDVHRRIADEARRNALAVIDLQPAYARARERVADDLSADFLHPNDVGHAVAAGALFGWLCESQALPPGAVDCARRTRGDSLDAHIARALSLQSRPARESLSRARSQEVP